MTYFFIFPPLPSTEGALRLGRMRMSLLRRDTWVPHTFCRAGPVCPAGGAGNNRSGRCRHRPLRKRILWCVGEGLCPSRGRPQGSPLRRGYKECDAGRNPPVTASPCQPPLGKGAEGTGDGLPRAPCALAMTEAERICVSFRDQSADWSWESVIPLHKGRGERIATASVRTGFAMT